jgi:hypothetical protein
VASGGVVDMVGSGGERRTARRHTRAESSTVGGCAGGVN